MLKVLVGKKAKGGEELKWQDIPAEEFNLMALTEALFGGARTFVLEGAINSDRQEEFLGMAKTLAGSMHTFIFVEEKLLKAPTIALEKAGAKIEVVKTEKKERGFDPFGLTFALGARDKKKLWLGLMQAFRAGEKPEALAGLLHWKVRNELERASGIKKEELSAISRKLVFMYHDSHRGAGDLELLLERFALTL